MAKLEIEIPIIIKYYRDAIIDLEEMVKEYGYYIPYYRIEELINKMKGSIENE